MNLFADFEAPAVETLNPRDWTLDDCKSKLRVQFRPLKNRPDCVSVSVRLGGVTALKIGENGKTSVHMLKSRSDKESILNLVKEKDDLIKEAKDRYVDSLNTARTTRNITLSKPKSKVVSSAAVINNVTTSSN